MSNWTSRHPWQVITIQSNNDVEVVDIYRNENDARKDYEAYVGSVDITTAMLVKNGEVIALVSKGKVLV